MSSTLRHLVNTMVTCSDIWLIAMGLPLGLLLQTCRAKHCDVQRVQAILMTTVEYGRHQLAEYQMGEWLAMLEKHDDSFRVTSRSLSRGVSLFTGEW